MELGCHAVLVGTAIAEARDPEVMAEAMRHAVEAGRAAYKAGRIARRLHRNAFGSPD
jgi:thiazole synthase